MHTLDHKINSKNSVNLGAVINVNEKAIITDSFITTNTISKDEIYLVSESCYFSHRKHFALHITFYH